MAYLDKAFYAESFVGESITDGDFPALLERASEIVEEMCMYRLTPITFLAMPEWVQEKVKKAICAQIEYLDANGGSEFDTGENLSSASLGKFSYSAGSITQSSGRSRYAPRAMRILVPTGLLYRGGG